MTTATATPRSHHELPNAQVLDSADQFYTGFKLLISAGPRAGVLLPALHCASIAMELYLKSLSAREVEVPDLDLGGVLVYAKSAAKSHKLEDLFDQVPKDFQDAIDAAVRKRVRFERYPTARDMLAGHNAMFMSSRYPFEAQRQLDGIDLYALGELLLSLKDGIRALPTRFVT